MERDELEALVRAIASGEVAPEAAVSQLAGRVVSPTARTADTAVDVDRARRCGFPEVVYCPGKSPASVVAIFEMLLDRHGTAFATRADEGHVQSVLTAFPGAVHNEFGRTLRCGFANGETDPVGRVVVVSAGTTDRPVAEEALETLRWMGCETDFVMDVGVAGPHRLPEQLDRLAGADVVVVAAGMEGALPSVVGGWVDCPVVAVPTSVGYGASLGGIAALLSMLNSCASNVTVVNIDAGFKAGYVAGLIATRAAARGKRPDAD